MGRSRQQSGGRRGCILKALTREEGGDEEYDCTDSGCRPER